MCVRAGGLRTPSLSISHLIEWFPHSGAAVSLLSPAALLSLWPSLALPLLCSLRMPLVCRRTKTRRIITQVKRFFFFIIIICPLFSLFPFAPARRSFRLTSARPSPLCPSTVSTKLARNRFFSGALWIVSINAESWLFTRRQWRGG